MNSRADGVRKAQSLFQATGSGAVPTSALQLLLEPIDYKDARKLNRLWHSRLPAIGSIEAVTQTAALCYGFSFEGIYYASAIWSNPVARNLPQTKWLELRRLAIAPDAPKNTASRMLSVMTRFIRMVRPQVTTLVSYQDTAVHTGGIYKAAGWKPTRLSDGDDWTGRKGREDRKPSQTVAPKQRWEKELA